MYFIRSPFHFQYKDDLILQRKPIAILNRSPHSYTVREMRIKVALPVFLTGQSPPRSSDSVTFGIPVFRQVENFLQRSIPFNNMTNPDQTVITSPLMRTAAQELPLAVDLAHQKHRMSSGKNVPTYDSRDMGGCVHGLQTLQTTFRPDGESAH